MPLVFVYGERAMEKNQTTVQPEKEIDVLTAEPAKVILFNDDIHTFDEVIAQIIKAIKCDSVKAETIAWEAHTKGKALVFSGDLSECLKVNSVLEEIALHTQIEL